MNTTARLAAVTEGLYRATLSGSLEWEIGSSEDTFIASVGNLRVEVTTDTGSFETVIRLNLYNSASRLADSFSDSDLSSVKPQSNRFNSYFNLLVDLHSLARRAATGADKVVDEILASLGAEEIAAIIDKEMTKNTFPLFDKDLDDDVPF